MKKLLIAVVKLALPFYGLVLLSACGGLLEEENPTATQLIVLSGSAAEAAALDGATVSGEIEVGLDYETGVRKASFFLDAPEDSEVPIYTDTEAPFVLSLDTTALSDGEHTLTVVVIRQRGAVRLVANSRFTVDNSGVQPREPVANEAPVVDAGEDQTVVLPAELRLRGSALDDGQPKGNLVIAWHKQSGPGSVSFAEPSSLETVASFSAAGSYVLKLSASDGELSSSDTLAVEVEPEAEPEPDSSAYWQPKPGLSWFWQLSGSINMNQNVDVYDIDYETSAHVVRELQAQGKKVIAYVPVGDWEDYRPDSDNFPEEALCGSIDGWPERYIDIRHPKAVELIKARIALAASKGFDGIEGDVVDLHLADTGCSPRITEAEMTAYLKELSAYAHSLGLAYFAKNVTENAAEWSTFTDGVVVEEAYQYREAAGYMPYILAGKPVFAVEYGTNKPTEAQCEDASARGYALYGTNLNLTGKVYKTCW